MKDYLQIKNKFKYFAFIVIYFICYPIAKFLYGRKNNWLICERGNDAQDNGYFFYKFLRENHPEINPIFLINRNSSDLEKIQSLGKHVKFGSAKHFLMSIGCPVKISSHLFGYAPWIQMALYFRRRKTHDLHVFLQHGITKNDQPGFYKKNCKSMSIFICGAKTEFDYILNEFGYDKSTVYYTGFPRYDSLAQHKEKNQLLFMPTWRKYLEDIPPCRFNETNFYISWAALLNDSRLLEYCRQKRLFIKFYLHNLFQKYSSLFSENDVVSVVKFSDEDVQTLLKESKLLVTDFSSVFFDFAYMNKPVSFYQFDEVEYNKKHYAKGFFDYRKDGFGDVCTDSKQLIDSIIKTIENDFGIDKNYQQNANKTFIFHDKNNSSRIFSIIKSKLS